VNGDIEPDRWVLDRKTVSILGHEAPSGRERTVRTGETGTAFEDSPGDFRNKSPLGDDDVKRVYEMAIASEEHFSHPQDMEWTIRGGELFLLQSRPITTLKDKEKSWYLSLKRTFDNLKRLRARIEDVLIPRMISDSRSMSVDDPGLLNDADLAELITSRRKMFLKWDAIYIKDFIPFAHGMRLFGDVYNEKIRPSDPYEFMDLLTNTDLLSIRRNSQLNMLAKMVRKDESLRKELESGRVEGEFSLSFEKFMEDFGHSSYVKDRDQMLAMILELSSNPKSERGTAKDPQFLKERFFSGFDPKERSYASELLEIGRASYKLRDDDNIHLGRIEGYYLDSLKEGKRRLSKRGFSSDISDDDVIEALKNNNYVPKRETTSKEQVRPSSSEIRQIQGQPASKGIVSGAARVIKDKDDLFSVKSGEVLVCDAIDPNMTFVIPLISGIVERRGGMLIHGAIIAREYGIPCVTGIPDATDIIDTGDEVTVDGYLGILLIDRK
ncbi:MAG: PEP-utilizing enzyme, partial [Halobacteriota archaeon]